MSQCRVNGMVSSVASPAKPEIGAAIELAFLVGNSLPIQLGAHLTLERCKRPFDQCQFARFGCPIGSITLHPRIV